MYTSKAPEGAEIIRSYAEYGQFVAAFFQGHYQLLVVIGRPGLSKSFEFEQGIEHNSHLIKGWVAPLQAFIDAYLHRNKLLIFDDAEVLWKRPGGRVLLRSLCEHKPRKTIQWASTAKDLVKAKVPQRFVTSSKVAIIANRFAFGSEDEKEAVLDRGHLIYFDPTPFEVHMRVGDWFWDQQIYDHIGERLHLFSESSARIYLKAWERKQANGNWTKLIEERFCHDKAKLLVQALETDPTCATVKQRVANFVAQTSLCRATYFNLKRELKSNDQLIQLDRIDVPKRRLHGTPPNEFLDDLLDSDPEPDAATPIGSSGDVLEWEDQQQLDDPADWWKKPRPNDKIESSERDVRVDDECSWLRREMEKAIKQENYERAAEFRDLIKRIEDDRDETLDR